MCKLVAFLLLPLLSLFTFPMTMAVIEEDYLENLFLTSVPNGDILSVFNFTIVFKRGLESIGDDQQSTLPIYIPWLFQHLFEQHSIEEFYLSMTQGFWRTNLWGSQMPGTESPSGIELLVEFVTETDTSSLPKKWSDLVHTINGLFCTSILQVLPQYTAQPKITDLGESFGGKHVNLHKWYGALGGESVCTENIKSWKKFLPCKQNGLVMLMEPTTLLSARYHSISIKSHRRKNAKGELQWDFVLLAKTVHDVERLTRIYRDITLENLFDRKLDTKCYVSSQGRIIVAKNEQQFDIAVGQPHNQPSILIEDEKVAVFNLDQWNERDGLDIVLRPKPNNPYNQHQHHLSGTFTSTELHMHSFVASTNQIGGRICTQIVNPFRWPIANAKFMHMLPWQIRIFLHTLNSFCSPAKATPEVNGLSSLENTNQSAFTLALDGKRPLLVELQISLPPSSVCKIEVEYEAAFLKITDFPPDANSGIFVPGAVLTIPLVGNDQLAAHLLTTSPVLAQTDSMKIFAEPLLILTPVPDFSMPFNVICLVCTVVAIYYGNIFTLSTKLMKLVPKEGDNDGVKGGGQTAPKTMLFSRIRAAIVRCWLRMCVLMRFRKEDSKEQIKKEQ